jgi:hypothetical protein
MIRGMSYSRYTVGFEVLIAVLLKIKSFGMLHNADWCMITAALKDCSAM